MLDKSIPYYEFWMKRKKGTPFNNFALPADFKFVLFKAGDEISWAEITTSVLEFDSTRKLLHILRVC